MDITYDNINEYFKNYFATFNEYGQDRATIHRMDEYFAPDFEFKPYIAGVTPEPSREAFYNVLVSHPSGYEKLTPVDIVFDERRMIAVVLILAEISDSKTGELLVRKYYFGRYTFGPADNNIIKIKELMLFWEVLPEGAMEISDVFARDWNK